MAVDRKQQMKEITERLEQGVKDIFTSEMYTTYLRTMAKFHNYSFNNTLLIAMQRPDATLVAGFNAWKKKFNGFLAPKAEGSYLILNEGGYQIEGQTDTWKVIDEKNVQEQRFVQLVCEQTKKQKPDIVLHDSGVLVAQTIYGFDSSVMKKIEKFLREQKPELLHHQKFLENGTAERAKESGTEQNYNMIDGCVNNNPKKPRIIGNRISVLDRLHIKLEERKQKSQPQQQQQQERSRKN